MREIKYVVIHHSAVRQPDINKAIASFNENHKRLHSEPNGFGYHIAYHYVVGEYGEVVATRPESEVGYHASNLSVNNESIGICLVGNFDERGPLKVQMDALNKLLYDLSDKYQFTIQYHNEYSTKSCPGKYFPYSQVKDPFILYNTLMSFYKNIYEQLFPGDDSDKTFTDPQKAIEVCFKPDGTVIAEELVYLMKILTAKIDKRIDLLAKGLSDPTK